MFHNKKFYLLDNRGKEIQKGKNILDLFKICNYEVEKINNICPFCMLVRNKTMIHCCVCNSCINNWDHHCFWLNICINERIVKVFITFCVLLLLICFFDMIIFSNGVYLVLNSDLKSNNFNKFILLGTICILLLMIYGFIMIIFILRERIKYNRRNYTYKNMTKEENDEENNELAKSTVTIKTDNENNNNWISSGEKKLTEQNKGEEIEMKNLIYK